MGVGHMKRDPNTAPDLPPRALRIYITAGENPVVEGTEAFVDYELEAVYTYLLYSLGQEDQTEEEEAENG
jgi:hypothetical protein